MKRLNIIEVMDHPKLFGPWFKSPIKAANCLPMTDDEVAFFRSVAERDPPRNRPRQCQFPIAWRRSQQHAWCPLRQQESPPTPTLSRTSGTRG
jgi:hypothetical protein